MPSQLDATTTPFSLSVLTATYGNASKRLVPDAHGQPIKDPGQHLGISSGRVEHVQVTGLAGLRDLLARIQQNQALVHGVPKDSTPGAAYQLVLAEQYAGVPGTIARTLDCFNYPPGPRLIMLDYDPEPESTQRLASAQELMDRLAAIWPAFGEAGWLATVSTSSAIRDKQTQAWLRPPEGMHVYVLTTGDVSRWRALATVRLWLAGYGFCKLASPNQHTGVRAILERCLIDLTVFSPERLDYVSGAKIARRAPFHQDRPPPELHPGRVLDLESLPDVTEDERNEYAALLDEARARMAPEQRRVIREHIMGATPDLPEADIAQEICTRLERAERGELDPTHPLYFDNGAMCTAGALSKAQDGKRLRDPLEPDYGPSQAVFHWHGGNWRIVSWAHGVRRVYQLVPMTADKPRPQYSYRATAHGTVWDKAVGDGTVPVTLANFTAKIIEDVLSDDGVEQSHVYTIDATLNGCTHRLSVAAAHFPSLVWVQEHLGAEGLISPGQSLKDHLRFAIQALSLDGIGHRKVYAHTGWRQHNGEWVYLHAGGAIGKNGAIPDIDVSLPTGLKHLALPNPPTGEALKTAVRASLRLQNLGPDRVSIPLWASLYRAVLGQNDASLHLSGPTGAGKTECATLAQQHFGAEFSARTLPANWSSTSNSLEGLAFTLKDAILVIDDFAPGGTGMDVSRQHREADRVLRAQGNHSGRQRMRPDSTLRPERPPRGFIISTGEDVPRGQSLRARLVILEVSPGDITWDDLTQCQYDAANGFYAQAMAAYLQWLAPRYADITRNLHHAIDEKRAKVATGEEQHKRITSNIAGLLVAVEQWLAFALDVQAITAAELRDIAERCTKALIETGAQQGDHQAASEPTWHFLRLISAAIASGRAHVAATNGLAPEKAGGWGSREHAVGTGDYIRNEWQPQGRRIGWIENDNLYLEAEASYAEAQKLAGDQGDSLAVSAQMLRKRMYERKLLVTTGKDAGRPTFYVRRTIEGTQRYVLHISTACLSLGGKELPKLPNDTQERPAPESARQQKLPIRQLSDGELPDANHDEIRDSMDLGSSGNFSMGEDTRPRNDEKTASLESRFQVTHPEKLPRELPKKLPNVPQSPDGWEDL
jgi:hypothetical protein